MTLAGGEPKRLSLEEFLDAAFVLLVENIQARGELFTAMDALQDVRSGGLGKPKPQNSPQNTEAQNDAAMRELQAMMGGLGR